MNGDFSVPSQYRLRGLFNPFENKIRQGKKNTKDEIINSQENYDYLDSILSKVNDSNSKKISSEIRKIGPHERDNSQYIIKNTSMIDSSSLVKETEILVNSVLENNSEKHYFSQGSRYFQKSQRTQEKLQMETNCKNIKGNGKRNKLNKKGQITKSSQNQVTAQILRDDYKEDRIIEEEDEDYEMSISLTKVKSSAKFSPFQSQKILNQKIKVLCRSNFQVNFFKVEQTGIEMNISTSNKEIFIIVPIKLAETMIIGKCYDICFNIEDLVSKEIRNYVYLFTDNIKECK